MDSVLRQAARLVVIGPDDRVLLFRYEDGPRTWWATPGGGLEGEETFEEAAVREAVEELSLTEPRLTALWCQTVEFSFRGQWIRQVERYFLVRLSSGDVVLDESVRKAHCLEGIFASRWWSLEEIEETLEPVFPEDLGERLRGPQR
jgi:ADP-ribose pyrophosphatase YjhB (NUDIX family)